MQKIKKGYKYVKGIKEIPEEWEVKKFGDIVKLSQYGTSKSNNPNYGYHILRMGNLENGKICLKDLAYVDLDEEEFKKLKINKGDLLFNRTNSYDLVGKVALFEIDGDYVCASYLIRFVLNNRVVNNKFINYYFNTFKTKQKLKSLATKGVSQSNINANILKKNLLIPLPFILEQQKIAQILSTWDEAIDKTEKLIEEKKIQKKALMQQLLTGKKRLKEFEGEEWEKVKLKKVLKSRNEKSQITNKLPLYSLTIEAGVTPKTNRYNREFLVKQNNKKYKIVQYNDIVYNPANLRFGAISLNKNKSNVLVSPIYEILLISDNKKYDVNFIAYVLTSHRQIAIFSTKAEGTLVERMAVKINAFLNTEIKVPLTCTEQRAIANILTTADKEINILVEKLDVLKQQKKGLMQNLLTGKIRVKV